MGCTTSKEVATSVSAEGVDRYTSGDHNHVNSNTNATKIATTVKSTKTTTTKSSNNPLPVFAFQGGKNKQQQNQAPLARERVDSWGAPAAYEAAAAAGASRTPTSSTMTSSFATDAAVASFQASGASAPFPLQQSSFSAAAASAASDAATAAAATAASTASSSLLLRPYIPPPIPSVELQWKQLWEGHKSLICDAQDVHAVLDGCMSSLITLSACDAQLLANRVRWVVQNGYGSDNEQQGGGTAAAAPSTADTIKRRKEAKMLVEKHRLLNETALSWLLPSCASSNSSNGSSSNSNSSSSSAILPNLLVLGASLSETLWDRVALVAIESDKLAKQQIQILQEQEQKIESASLFPKPSLVIPVMEPYNLHDHPTPVGMSVTALAVLLSLGLQGTRNQRLQLLFYLCMDQLAPFLAHHPGGGVPTFLLEVDQQPPLVLSTASLTHYHYYGNTYLPDSSLSKHVKSFVESKSRPSPRLSPLHLAHVIQAAAAATTTTTTTTTSASSATATTAASTTIPNNNDHNISAGTPTNTGGGGILGFTRGGGGSSTNVSGVDRGAAAADDNNNNDSELFSPPQKSILQRLSRQQNTLTEHEQLLQIAKQLLQNGASSSSSGADRTLTNSDSHHYNNNASPSSSFTTWWTLPQFDHWASHALADDQLLHDLLYRLLGHGLLPTPAQEKQWVQDSWRHFLATTPMIFTPSSSSQTEEHEGRTTHTTITTTTAAGATSTSTSSVTSVFTNTISTMIETYSAACGVNGGYRQMSGDGVVGGGGAAALSRQPQQQQGTAATPLIINPSRVWGGLGGLDGGGGIGHGVLYCIDKRWWDLWAEYVQWTWVGDRAVLATNDKNTSSSSTGSMVSLNHDNSNHINTQQSSSPSVSRRPEALSTEHLLDLQGEVIGGMMGSYEVMKHGLRRNLDYVLIPPGVWDVLYELYGGGPPLPRMVKPTNEARKVFNELNRTTTDLTGSENNTQHPSSSGSYNEMAEDLDNLVQSLEPNRVPPLPDNLQVVLHPWILHVHLCDPLQPYRRGEVGPLTIRVMATPDQPLWRLFVEVIVRFPLQTYKAFVDNRGKARLWKKVDRSPGPGQKDPMPRYGPWNLLCKSRHAIMPLLSGAAALKDVSRDYNELVENWKIYTDNATVESVGLCDQDHMMLEFAILSKAGELLWPREAAAKAGRVRRLAEEDMKFRRTLQGVDEKGELMLKPPELVGMEVDAMDATGRWYPVTILEADIIDDDTDEDAENEDASGVSNGGRGGEGRGNVSRKKVRVDFKEFGGHAQWIDVESDRLAVLGRFTSDAERQNEGAENSKPNSNTNVPTDPKPKLSTAAKKSSGDLGAENGKICVWPGFGACGLTNLGNTCYVNSAIQCISYLPLLRSYLLSAQYKCNGDLNKDNPIGTGGKLLEEFAELLRALWSGRLGEKSPTRFRAQLGKINSQFSGGDQQDAQEFLNYILDVLHEDSNKVRKKPYVEALEDDWVEKTALPRVADEAWRRFLRRNRSIMTDVAMGQVLNTVTCPVCNYSSRNFDPFNLLSIPIPTVADVIFKCIVFRRATSMNCPWILNKPRKGDTAAVRFVRRASSSPSSPPSESHATEQYVIAMSRLADSGDLRLQIQNTCGIPASQLRLCRVEETVIKNGEGGKSVVSSQMKVIALADKEGPCSSLAKKRAPGEETATPVTLIVAFEHTLRPRLMQTQGPKEEVETLEDTADEEDEAEIDDDHIVPTPKEQALIYRYLDVYGDEKECRLVDTNPLLISKAVSRSLWPRTDKELKLGLRVDARDHRGNWFPGNVVEIVEDEVSGGDADTGEEVSIRTKKVRVHFDNFSSKWDEMYSIDHFEAGNVRPLYSHSSPRSKPTEIAVHNRHTDRTTGHSVVFGQTFYIQCMNDWSNARAGAHIIAQASRFLRYDSEWGYGAFDDPEVTDREGKARRLYEKTQTCISELIDLLVDYDREYVRLALGVSDHHKEEEKVQPFRNPSFDPTPLSSLLVKKVSALLTRLPFEVRVCTVETTHNEKPGASSEEIPFPFSLIRTIGNYLNARHAVILQWREPPIDKKTGSSKYYLDAPVMYVEPKVEIDKISAERLAKTTSNGSPSAAKNNDSNAAGVNSSNAAATKNVRGGSGGIDLGVCLTEFCKVQNLSLADNWKCPHCKKFREGQQSMNLWRLPDLLTFHIKRFNMSARWREKITTKVNFPLTGLDMSEWCHMETSPQQQHQHGDSYVYDLIGVVNHYGSMTGGHYVAICKATTCSKDGREEVAYNFNGVGAHDPIDKTCGELLVSEEPATSGWRLGRPNKSEVNNQNKVMALTTAQAASESAEPLWLQFDDDNVEPIPPRLVVSETAYVLFYRRRRMTPSNITKYSTLY